MTLIEDNKGLISKFAWNGNKKGHKQHILDETGKTYCRLENSGFSRLTEKSVRAHTSRAMCGTCQHQLAKRKRKRGQSGRKKAEPTGNNFYATKEWARLRYMAFEKYGTQCAVCGGDKSHGVRLTVDHIKPVKKYPELALDINNLQVLCTLCNRGKGASFETDWRNLDAEYRDIIGD